MNFPQVRASIVTYQTDRDELERCVGSLHNAGVGNVAVVDNSPTDDLREFCGQLGVAYMHTPENRGYGAAHNVELRKSLASADARYHLVINSDVYFDADVIGRIIEHMDSNPAIGQLIPRTIYPDGREQAVVRLLPTPLDPFARRFLPPRLAAVRNRRYLLETWPHDTEENIPYHQGSFMFMRVSALREVGLFDERFFMYPEDIDLTRRMHRHYLTVFWPGATIVHKHRAESYHSRRMTWIHIVNMARYFNKWGWFFDRERRRFNRGCCQRIAAGRGRG
ncbi:MAG: glycosyltransferase family 2 protein [Bacteroides sp.]|nr:glycosyltransferase family 2 protein [Bacteroides sp.]MCM1379306.1 glycosyltransferase family 2 protein [Bacteroides sp.]MCM1445035.1 glycosyltransferase family 2 protein [Prevotella sp.]